jgi:hypothetical protein
MLPSESTALITGASSGLGAEFANQLAAWGYNLILVSRREELLEQVAGTIRSKYGVRATVLPADLAKPADLERVISVIHSTQNIEMLVNNAGFGIFHKFLRADPEMEQALLQVHVTAPVMLCRAALQGMTSRNKGAIINVSSIAGIIPIRSVLYGSSKSFLISFSEALQEELRETNIHIQALCPGFIITEFHDTIEYSRFSRDSIPGFLWLKPEKVVNESLYSIDRKRVIVIPGNFYRFAGALARNNLTAGLIKNFARYVLRRRK